MLQERQLEGSFEKTPYFYLQLQKWLNDNIGAFRRDRSGLEWGNHVVPLVIQTQLYFLHQWAHSFELWLCSVLTDTCVRLHVLTLKLVLIKKKDNPEAFALLHVKVKDGQMLLCIIVHRLYIKDGHLLLWMLTT